MRFFTSDLHFGHTNIIKYCNRPYANDEEMIESLVENWNSVVAPDDEAWVLGDVAMGKKIETLQIVRRLHGIKILIPGNHDACWEYGHAGKKFNYWMGEYQKAGFQHIFQGPVRLIIGGKDVLLSHFPYVDDKRHGDSYAEYRPKDRGLPLLHGHVHGSWQTLDRMINVGVDVWDYEPVSELEIEQFI